MVKLIPEHVFKLFIYLFINQTQTIMEKKYNIYQLHSELTNYYNKYEDMKSDYDKVKWILPFSDQKNISLNKNKVIINLPVTIGLEKYYEYVLKKMDLGDGPSEEELKAIEEEEKQGLKDQMLEYIKDGYTIH